ncbi:Protocadherin-1 [Bagarius yarrelli]|uniref:Protocadherin-1 n=1 Tax=Bagarius yarrelli TaxID=175774 RepID=A0A556V560_BAGYA|nr:Protocadherin-1 [Bagarius yarrelli]
MGGILYRVREEQPPSTLIGSLAADQGLPDSGHLYKLEVGAPYLRVDGKTGEIFTTEIPIDRETLKDCRIKGKPCFLEFEVSVTDLIQNQSPRLIEGRIEVLDINDNTPQFASPVLTISVQENTHVGATFSIPLATDKDTERNGVADYTLTAGPEAVALFGLQVADDRGEKLPQLIVMGNLDRELKDSYDLTLKVVDGGSPSRYSSALLRVVVTDANDNAPKFEKSSYEAEVSENSPVGHSVLQVKANDSDLGPNGEIEYIIHQASDPVPKLLQIDRSTGIIYVKGPLDREEISSFKFHVVARDKGPSPKSSTTYVSVEVTDQNDNAPAVEIRGIGLRTHSDGVANIPEDMPVGTAVALVQVSDKDEGENAVVTCVVAGDVPFQLRPAGDSSIDNKKKYFLQTTMPLDFERVRDYRVEIVAVDSGNPALSSTNSLKVQVTDINDNSPIFSPPLFEIEFAEENQPGEKVLDVIAVDADSGTNADLIYSIVADSTTRGLFEIDPSTGEVRARSPLDREHKERYEFRVTATDKGVPSHKGTATVVIKVLDRNDNDPKFMLSSYSFSVLENMPPLSPVGMVTVLDMDKGENSQVQLSVEPDVGKFVVQNGTGTILSSISFDREKESSYSFRLKAVDKGEPPRSSYVGVTINVLDENDNAPVVTKPANSSFKPLSPLAAPDTVVEMVEAEDIDSGSNAELFFTIAGGNPHELFYISPSDGEIKLTKELTRKHGGLHRLVVKVSDRGKPSRHAIALVHIYVNETISNVSLVEGLVGHSLYTPLDTDIAGDPDYGLAAQRSNILYGSLAGMAGVVTVIIAVVFIRHRLQRETKSGYQAGKKETKDLYAPKQGPKSIKGKKRKGKPPKATKPLGEDEEVSLQKSLKFSIDGVNDSPRIHLPLTYPPGSPDLGRHYRSNSPLPSIQLQAQSPSASQKHQAVQELPATNTFVGTERDDNSTGSDQYSDYSYKTSQPKYSTKSPSEKGAEIRDGKRSYFSEGLAQVSGTHSMAIKLIALTQQQSSKTEEAFGLDVSTDTLLMLPKSLSMNSAQIMQIHSFGQQTRGMNKACFFGVGFRRILPHRRVTFSTANPMQDAQDSSQQSYYDSGLEESETPSSKSSSGPRLGPLALPEEHYERTTPDGSIGEMEHPENGKRGT